MSVGATTSERVVVQADGLPLMNALFPPGSARFRRSRRRLMPVS